MTWFMLWVVLSQGHMTAFGGQAYSDPDACRKAAYEMAETLMEKLGTEPVIESTCIPVEDVIQFGIVE